MGSIYTIQQELFDSIKSNNIDHIKKIISSGFDVNARENFFYIGYSGRSDYYKLIDWIVRYGNLEILKIFLANGFVPNENSKLEYMYDLNEKQIEIIRYIIEIKQSKNLLNKSCIGYFNTDKNSNLITLQHLINQNFYVNDILNYIYRKSFFNNIVFPISSNNIYHIEDLIAFNLDPFPWYSINFSYYNSSTTYDEWIDIINKYIPYGLNKWRLYLKITKSFTWHKLIRLINEIFLYKYLHKTKFKAEFKFDDSLKHVGLFKSCIPYIINVCLYDGYRIRRATQDFFSNKTHSKIACKKNQCNKAKTLLHYSYDLNMLYDNILIGFFDFLDIDNNQITYNNYTTSNYLPVQILNKIVKKNLNNYLISDLLNIIVDYL